jgi:hypothetical protein
MRDLEVPYLILLDLQKDAYRRWCMSRTTLRASVFSLTLTARYVKLLLHGERFLGLVPDMLQLGGDFVIDPQGRIAFAHAMKNNGDHAAVLSLIEAIERAAVARP